MPRADQSITVLLDENVPQVQVPDILLPLVRPLRDVELLTIRELRMSGRSDLEVVRLAAEKKMLLITGDRGRRPGPKISLLCNELGVTHVVLAPKLNNERGARVAQALASVWPSIIELCDRDDGLRHRLRRRPIKGNPDACVIEPWPMK